MVVRAASIDQTWPSLPPSIRMPSFRGPQIGISTFKNTDIIIREIQLMYFKKYSFASLRMPSFRGPQTLTIANWHFHFPPLFPPFGNTENSVREIQLIYFKKYCLAFPCTPQASNSIGTSMFLPPFPSHKNIQFSRFRFSILESEKYVHSYDRFRKYP